MRLDALTSTEFQERMRSKPVIILPIGGTEAHGSHLPLCTDSVQPELVADAVSERVGALVAPPLRYAFHSSTRNMPGTIGLSFPTTIAVIRDILESLIAHGADKLVVLSGHAGSSHMAAVRQACADVVKAHDVTVMALSDYDLAKRYPIDQKGDGHGGLLETSRTMAIVPDLARRADVRGDYVSLGFEVVRDPERTMPLGYVGDAASASAELGVKVNAFIIDQLHDEIERTFGGRR